MTDKLRDAAQMALEAICSCGPQQREAAAALRAALAEPDEAIKADQQLPYCYTYTENGEEYFAPPSGYRPDHAKPLYAAPQPKAEPVGTYNEVMQTMLALQTGTLEQQQAFALLKDKSLYEAPQPRRRLTDEEIQRVYREFMLYQDGLTPSGMQRVARAIERAHGIGGEPTT